MVNSEHAEWLMVIVFSLHARMVSKLWFYSIIALGNDCIYSHYFSNCTTIFFMISICLKHVLPYSSWFLYIWSMYCHILHDFNMFEACTAIFFMISIYLKHVLLYSSWFQYAWSMYCRAPFLHVNQGLSYMFLVWGIFRLSLCQMVINLINFQSAYASPKQ